MAFPGLKGIEKSFYLFCAEGIELGVQSFSRLAHHLFLDILQITRKNSDVGAAQSCTTMILTMPRPYKYPTNGMYYFH